MDIALPGVSGIECTRRMLSRVLLEAVDAVASGRHYLSRDVAHVLASSALATEGAAQQAPSTREFEVLKLLAQECALSEIAGQLGIHQKTVTLTVRRLPPMSSSTSFRARLPSPLVETAWLEGQLSTPDLRILDCSVVMKTTPDGGYVFTGGREEWELSHIPGSVFVDVMTDLAAKDSPLPMMMPPMRELAEFMSALGVGEGTRVVLYDRSNHAWAARVWWMLRAAGFDDAAVLNGGWQKWVAEGRPASAEPARYFPANFRPRPRPDAFASKAEVQAALQAKGTRLINALSPEEHRGTATRFPRPGRIPGSVNVYCQSLVDPRTHAYLPAEQMRSQFEAAGALGADRVITYCGAGIAASSDAFALALLGKSEVAVYDGSLAEWTADATLPMETD